MKGLSSQVQLRLRRLKLLARRTFRGAGAGERRARSAGVSTEFRDHRQYAPGDDLRHLDWNVYARLERLYLKRFHDHQDVTLHLVLDATASMAYGTPPKLAAARALAGSLAWIALAAQDRARLHVVAGPEPASSPDFAGRARLQVLLREIEAVAPGGAAALDAAFEAVARRIRRPGIVVVVSDLLSPGAVQGLQRLAAGRHQVHVAWLLSPEDRDPDRDERLRADMTLVDAETGAHLPVTLSPALRQAYRDALADHERELRATCRRLGAGFTALSSADGLEESLFVRLAADGLVG
jgi:uncharacterized protein (DUF58 family)